MQYLSGLFLASMFIDHDNTATIMAGSTGMLSHAPARKKKKQGGFVELDQGLSLISTIHVQQLWLYFFLCDSNQDSGIQVAATNFRLDIA